MIVSNINNPDNTLIFPEPIKKLLEIFKTTDFSTVEHGLHEVQGLDLFYVVKGYNPKSKEDAPFESHKNYIDVQFVFQGEELIGYSKLNANSKVNVPYDDQKDIMFYETPSEKTYVEVSAGDFVILSPVDLHAPETAQPGKEKSDVIKVVGKVHVKLL